MTRRLAVIGTAGRDKTKVFDAGLWQAMCADFRGRVHAEDELVSGGAAWADHLAVHAFLQGWCGGLCLYLPAPLKEEQGHWHFEGTGQSSGSAATWYHSRFSAALGVDTMAQIEEARLRGAILEAEPAHGGFSGMFARNAKVATRCTAVVAYTFNPGDEPADGGTLNTWKQVRTADRMHVDLGGLQQRTEQPVQQRAARAAPAASAARTRTRAERYR